MSTELPNVQDPTGYHGDVAVTIFCGPEERRCIALSGFTGNGGDIQMSVPQFHALVEAISRELGFPKSIVDLPRVIEALSSDHAPIYVSTDSISAIAIVPGKPTGASGAGWTARVMLDTFTCYRTFETVEAAHAFARETLGMEPQKEIR